MKATSYNQDGGALRFGPNCTATSHCLHGFLPVWFVYDMKKQMERIEIRKMGSGRVWNPPLRKVKGRRVWEAAPYEWAGRVSGPYDTELRLLVGRDAPGAPTPSRAR